jgi:putative PIN family toxin of toxin-antitoxin system
MEIVLDTNVLVSGLLQPFGSPGEIVRLLAAGDINLSYDNRIIAEYNDVLTRPKFRFDKAHTDTLIDMIKRSGRLVAAKPLVKALPDPDDEPFLEVALAGRAHSLVTGNPKHYPKDRCHGIPILTPSKFLELLRG